MKISRQLFRLLATIAVCALFHPVFGQQPAGTVTGTVRDKTGAAVPGALVRVVSRSTGLSRQSLTAGDGTFTFPLLPAGTYDVSVEARGFAELVRSGIPLSANAVVTVPLELQVGHAGEVVTVESETNPMDASTGTLRETIEQQRILALPVSDRNATRLVLLAPGTSDQSNPGITTGGGEQARVSGYSNAVQVAYPGTILISSGGSRSDSVDYLLDGGSNRDIYLNLNGPLPNPEALQEVVVQTSNVSAEHRSSAGGVVSISTKSGTNQFHGSLFEFMRNDALDAAPFFNNTRGGGKDALKQHQFGGTAGGPVVRNRLFLFGSYQGLRIRKSATRTRFVVLNDDQRAGLFSGSSVAVDPVSAALMEYIPRATNQKTGEFFLSKGQPERENQYLVRADLTGVRHQVFGRYFDSRYPKDTVPGVKGNIYLGLAGYDFTAQNLSVALNSILSGSALNNAVFSFGTIETLVTGASPVGMNDLNPNVAGFPEINVTFGGGLSPINFLGRDREIYRRSWRLSDSAHWVKGSHDFAFGGDISRLHLNHVSHFRQAGFYTFASPRDFVAGKVRNFVQGGGEFTDKTYWARSLYANYRWRTSERLSLSLGLRWDPFEPPVDRDRKAVCFSPGSESTRFINAPPGILFAGEQGCPEAGFRATWANLAPRTGFAYSLDNRSRTILRGGGGLAYVSPFLEALNSLVANPPFSTQVAIADTSLRDPYGFKGRPNPFPEKFAPRVPSSNELFSLPAIVNSYASGWKPARVWNYNLTLEHRFPGDTVGRIAYVGAVSRNLSYNTDVNFPRTLQDLASGLRPSPLFGKMTQNQSGANASYHALQTGVSRRFARSLALEAFYTWSKSIDTVSAISDLDKLNVFNPLDPFGNRAVSDFDLRHRITASAVWQPGFRTDSGWVNHAVNGWQAAFLAAAQNGAPFSIVSSNNLSDDYETNQSQVLAVLVGRPALTDGAKGTRLAKWFDTRAFAATPNNSFGTAPRNLLHGPGLVTFDLALSRSFKVRERVAVQYRAEFFNALNHANFYLPNNYAGRAGIPNPDFGRITKALDPRIVQMALRFTF
jgi:hypothetical protein